MSKRRPTRAGVQKAAIKHFMLDRMLDLAVSMFEWDGVPETIDKRYIEVALWKYGTVCFFEDPEIGLLCLPYTYAGNFNVYGNPVAINAYSEFNGYHYSPDKFVIMWENKLRRPPMEGINMYAERIADLIRCCDINTNAQKTPFLISTTDTTKRSILAMYEQYDNGEPVIVTDKGFDVEAGLHVFATAAPFVAQDIMVLYNAVWNEFLTYLGVPNVSYVSGSRKVADEVLRSQGGTIASRFSPESAREEAVEQINKLFGTNISCNFRADFDEQYMHQPLEGGEHFGEERGDTIQTGG